MDKITIEFSFDDETKSFLEGIVGELRALNKNVAPGPNGKAAAQVEDEEDGDLDDDFEMKEEASVDFEDGDEDFEEFDDEGVKEPPEKTAREKASARKASGSKKVAARKKSNVKRITVQQINEACKEKARATSREQVLKILKSKFGVTSVTALDKDQYAGVLKAMTV